METEISRKIREKIYRKLYLIRFAEEQIINFYPENEMKTPMHMSMGSEAISTGICCALRKEDQVFGTYRSHALFLAKTEDVSDFFAEMYGKDTAFLKGRGGSMHMCAPHYGFLGTSAIVGSAIPLAIGAAFANKRLNNDKIVVVFFGDGAINEGSFWESLNFCCLMKIPVMFVCEDNDYAVHMRKNLRNGFRSIDKLIENFDCSSFYSSSTDADIIYDIAQNAISLMRITSQPSFLHLNYYRYLEHVGINRDFDKGYRSEEESLEWLKYDPIDLYREKMLSNGFSEREIFDIEKDVSNRVFEGLMFAKAAPFSSTQDIYY